METVSNMIFSYENIYDSESPNTVIMEIGTTVHTWKSQTIQVKHQVSGITDQVSSGQV